MKDFSVVGEFLELAKNPDKFANALKELQDMRDQALEAVSLLGPAKEIKQLRAQLEVEVNDAIRQKEDILNTAKANAAEIVRQADESRTKADEIKQLANKDSDEAAEAKKAAKVAEKEAQKVLTAAKAAFEEAEVKRQEAMAFRKEFEEKLEKLKNL